MNLPAIIFSWNQFGTVPVGGGIQYYHFELFEVLPYDANPEDVVRTQLPIHSEEVIGTQLIYDLSKPSLFEGQQYAWRIRAFDPTDQVYYKNDGYSTVCTFTIAQPAQDIASELDFRANAISMALAEVEWQPEDGKMYVVAHRRASDGTEFHWFTDTVRGPKLMVRGLTPGTTYEVKIAEQLEDKTYGPYSGTQTFRTFDYEAYDCQSGPTSFEPPANIQPLLMLVPGDVVQVADFEMVVVQASGQHGKFSGLGTIYVPWLGPRLAVTFQNIGINTDKQLISGEINFVQEVSVDQLIGKLPEPAAVDAAIVLTFAVNDASQMVVSIDGDQVTIHGPDDRIVSYKVPGAANGFTIADSKGNVYLATPGDDGKRVKVEKIGSKGQDDGWHKDVAERLNQLDPDNRVTFANGGAFAFDSYDEQYEGTPHAKEFEVLGDGYYVPWKFIPKGQGDKVRAELKGDLDP
ncbi:MAG: fibronectin type III domain-containing protein, partial [Cyclobacteriaceae bacterium]|nr:fibronectin type III domain-containing protein [Cyclobacteriaceae bacterium]